MRLNEQSNQSKSSHIRVGRFLGYEARILDLIRKSRMWSRSRASAWSELVSRDQIDELYQPYSIFPTGRWPADARAISTLNVSFFDARGSIALKEIWTTSLI